MKNDVRQTVSPEVQGNGSLNSGSSAEPPGSAGASCHQGSGLMGFLKMAACCAGPILLLAALPFLGGTLGVGGSALLSTAAILACPLGMGWMMWRMSRQQAVTSGQNHAPVSLEAGASEELKKEVRS